MARRRRTSVLEDAVEMLSWLFGHVPPWVSIPVAIVGFFVIRLWVNSGFKTPGLEILGTAFGGVWAIVWLAGGFGGWVRRRQQAAFLKQNIDIAWLNGLSWQEFERQIAEVY